MGEGAHEAWRAFLKALPARRARPRELAVSLQGLLARARSAWPDLPFDEEGLARHVASRLGTERDLSQALERLHAPDLLLAYACSQACPEAIAIVDERYLPRVAASIERVDGSAAFAQDVLQIVRERLFVAQKGRQAKIAEYAGRASLASWLRIVATGVALDMRRTRRGPLLVGEDPGEIPDPLEDPERNCLNARSRGALQQALREALSALPDRERDVLQRAYLRGESIDAIGEFYGVHRATAARWVVRARGLVLEQVRKSLAEKLRLSPVEIDSLLRLVGGELELTVSRLSRPDA